MLELTLIRLKEKLAAQKYQKQPMLWLSEKFKEDPKTIQWSKNKGYENHIFDGSPDPLYNAWMDLTQKKWAGLESATGTGKTYIASRIIYWFLDCFFNSLVVIIGPTSSQLKDNIWSELRTAHPKFKSFRPESIIIENDLRVIDNSDNKSWHAIMRSGSADGKNEEKASAKLSGFHREHMLFIFDEMQGVSSSAIETIENTCTGSNNLLLGLGNPDSKQDSLHKFCVRESISHYVVSGLDHPNVVLGNEMIPGAVSRLSIERRKKKYGEDSPFYLSRVRGICPEFSMNDLFDLDKFDVCCKHDVDFDLSSSALGIDPANSSEGDDACAVYGLKNYCMSIKVFKCPDASMIPDNLLLTEKEITSRFGWDRFYDLPNLEMFEIKNHNIAVDSIGVGVSTVNRFTNPYKMNVVGISGSARQDVSRLPLDAEGKPLYSFGNLRAQMIWQFAYDVNNLNISFKSIDNTLALNNIRLAMRYTKMINANNKNLITPKEDIKRYIGFSPNEFDAAVYWNWIRNNKKKEDIGADIFAVDVF
jgi:hypothetical protein